MGTGYWHSDGSQLAGADLASPQFSFARYQPWAGRAAWLEAAGRPRGRLDPSNEFTGAPDNSLEPNPGVEKVAAGQPGG